MKRLLSLVAFFATLQASAQQVNPVPDYVFRNQMSVGRNAVTDTAAYFSIGPRYGATKGFMPPIVGDTATFSSGKRNGLLIFSVQKNKFLYWDSVRVQWSDMAGSSGSYILAGDTSAMLAPYLRKVDTTSMLTAYLRKVDTTAMLSPYYRSATASAALALKLNISDTSSMLGNYIRHAGYGLTKSGQSFLVDTLNIATRAWRQKGLDSLAALEVSGSGTTNYVPKFTAGSTIGNSQIFDNGTNVGVGVTPGTTNLGKSLSLNYFGNGLFSYATDNVYLNSNTYYNGDWKYANSAAASQYVQFGGAHLWYTAPSGTANNNVTLTERLRITSGGNVGINNNNPSYRLDVGGSIGLNYDEAIYFRNVSGTGRQVLAYNGNTFLDSKDGYMSFRTDAAGTITERLRIFANGRIGINTTTDAGYQLDVNGTLRATSTVDLATAGGEVRIGTSDVGNYVLQVGGPTYLVGAANTSLTTSAGLHQIAKGDNTYFAGFNFQGVAASDMFFGRTASSDDLVISTSNTGSPAERVRFRQNGDVGIGTNSPAYKLDINGTLRSVNGANFATTSGNVGIGTASPAVKLDVTASGGDIAAFRRTDAGNALVQYTNANTTDDIIHRFRLNAGAGNFYDLRYYGTGGYFGLQYNGNNGLHLTTSSEVLINTTTDAGDYKLQVVGNARIGTGKLDIASNTTFGIGVARSGTSEVAGQIYNSNGILYLGAESSAGGQIFSGSSAYAAVVGSGANYPLQFATNNITRATMTTSGNLLLGFTTDSYFLKLQVNGSIFSNNQVLAQGVNAQIAADSSANISPLYISNQSLTGSSAQGLFYGSTTWNTTGNPSLIDLAITNTASGSDANYIKISDGSNIFRVTKAAEVVTAAPTGGSIRKWKLGEAATVSPTSPNRTIRVEIDGTVYYLHAKTTND